MTATPGISAIATTTAPTTGSVVSIFMSDGRHEKHIRWKNLSIQNAESHRHADMPRAGAKGRSREDSVISR
jgi:hypothetical protein